MIAETYKGYFIVTNPLSGRVHVQRQEKIVCYALGTEAARRAIDQSTAPNEFKLFCILLAFTLGVSACGKWVNHQPYTIWAKTALMQFETNLAVDRLIEMR